MSFFSIPTTNNIKYIAHKLNFHVKCFLSSMKPRSGFLFGMIKFCDLQLLFVSSFIKMMMIELTHFSAFIFGPFKEFILTVLKCSFIKKFMTLIGSFFLRFRFILELNKCKSFRFRKLLQFYIRNFFIVQIFIEQDIKIGLWSI